MKIFLLFLFSTSGCCLSFFLCPVVLGQSFTPSTDVEALVNDFFSGEQCSSISNISFTGSSSAIGSFSGTQSILGMDGGMMISTGNVANAVGPNDNSSTSTIFQLDAFEPLDQLSNSNIGGGNDAAYIQFDFIPLGELISFDLVFASEEYPEWQSSSFKDTFGCFIAGPGINGPFAMPGYPSMANMAIVPGTVDSPIDISSINSSNNSQFYVANNLNNLNIEYDGFTVPLTVSMSVTPCETYHIVFAIQDQGDSSYDSAVFFETNGFNVLQSLVLTAASEGTANNSYEGCTQGYFILTRNNADTSSPITTSVTIGGTATSGVDYTPLQTSYTIPAGENSISIPVIGLTDAISEGVETITMQLAGESCACGTPSEPVTINLLDNAQISASINGNSIACVGESQVLSAITDGTLAAEGFTFTWTSDPAGTTLGNTSNIVVSPSVPTTYVVSVADICGNSASSSFVVEPVAYSSVELSPLNPICETSNPLLLNEIQNGISGSWSGVGVTGNSFNPNGLSGEVLLTFSPNAGTCMYESSVAISILESNGPGGICLTDCNLELVPDPSICNDNDTPANPTDDTYNLQYDLFHTNVDEEGQFVLSINGVVIETVDYQPGGQTADIITGLPANGETVILSIVDINNNTCPTTATYIAPLPCSNSCSIFSSGYTTICHDNGTGTTSDDYFTVTVNPTGTGLGSTYSVSGDITASGLSYVSAQTIGGNNLISNGPLTITITDDNSGGACTITETIPLSVCPLCPPTPINNSETGSVCNGGGTDDFEAWQSLQSELLADITSPGVVLTVEYSYNLPNPNSPAIGDSSINGMMEDGCDPIQQIITAYMRCDKGTANMASDDIWTPMSSYELTVYPTVQEPTVEINMEDCELMVTGYCQNDVITLSDQSDPNGTISGNGSNVVIYTAASNALSGSINMNIVNNLNDNSCTYSQLNILTPACSNSCTELNAAIIDGEFLFCLNELLSTPVYLDSLLVEGSSPDGYWSINGQLSESGMIDNSLSAGSYFISYTVDPPLTDPVNCAPMIVQAVLEIQQCLGIGSIGSIDNPTKVFYDFQSQVLYLPSSELEYSYSVFDVNGRNIINSKASDRILFDQIELPTGIYLVKISDTHSSSVIKIFKR